jgi:pimeloyl-ACP methyl ester carboxylesterase
MQKNIVIAFFSILFSVSTNANALINKDAYTDNGRGKTIVLIHAFPADHHLWEPQIKSLSQKYRVITLDLKGFGHALPTDGETVTMRQYAAEVKQLMDQLHIKKAIIGGESMGGYISLAFLKAYPQNTGGLILSNTQAIADTAEQKAGHEKEAADVLNQGTATLVESFVPKALSSNATHEVKEFVSNMFANQKASGMSSGLRGIAARRDTSKTLAQTTVPVLIISGDLDEVIAPSESIKMSKETKNSKLVLIQGAGHLTNIERPDEWDAAVINYFN